MLLSESAPSPPAVPAIINVVTTRNMVTTHNMVTTKTRATKTRAKDTESLKFVKEIGTGGLKMSRHMLMK